MPHDDPTSLCLIVAALNLLACAPHPSPTYTPKAASRTHPEGDERHCSRMNEDERPVTNLSAPEGTLDEGILGTEASALAIDFLARHARSGNISSSIMPFSHCFHNCVSLRTADGPQRCGSWTCNFLISDHITPPIAMFTVYVTPPDIRAVPSVDFCIAKEHACSILVGRDEAIKRLQARLSDLAIQWVDEEREFFWVNTGSNERISCHRPTR